MLDVDQVTVHLGRHLAVRDASLRIAAGELVGLIGPNGAGKTTLLRAVLGLVPLTSGTVLIDDRPISSVRREIGYVPQRHEFAWDFPITVTGAVLSGRTGTIGWLRRPKAADRAAAEAALEQVGMSELARRPIGELSGGQRQRVLVARALAAQPRLLLLDEPLTGVDVPTQEVLSDLFVRLAAAGTALLMTTHDLPVARRTSTRLCLLNRTVIADDAPERLTDPALLLAAFGVDDSAGVVAAVEAR